MNTAGPGGLDTSDPDFYTKLAQATAGWARGSAYSAYTGATGIDPNGTYASPQGAWSSATAYTINQVVTYNGATYRAKASSTNVTPGTDATKWESWGGGSLATVGRLVTAKRPIPAPTLRSVQKRYATVVPKFATSNAPGVPHATTTAFSTSGGPFYAYGGAGWQTVSSAISPATAAYWTWETITDAPYWAITMTLGAAGTGFLEISVNDEIIYPSAPLPTGGSQLVIDWGGSRLFRKYTFKGWGGMTVTSVTTNVQDSLVLPSPDDKLDVAWFGDSYSQVPATDFVGSLPILTIDQLGWRAKAVSAVGGTGYNQGSPTYTARVPAAFTVGPFDLVIGAGGHNSRTMTQAGEQADCTAWINAVVAQGHPANRIVVLGVLSQGDSWTTAYAPVNAGLAAACAATGAIFVPNPIPNIITGTGNIQTGPPTGLTVTPVVGGSSFAGGSQHYMVTASDLVGETTPTSDASATIAANGSATLNWTAPVLGASDVTYNIYRGNTAGPGGTTTLVATGVVATTYTDVFGTTTTRTPPSTDSTGWKFDGNADVLINTDHTHPINGLGGEYFSMRLAPLIRAALAAAGTI